MKATGIVRRIDELGRVVIPKEIRRTLRIREGDPLEIYTDREGEVILKKYSPIGEMGDVARQFAESLHRIVGHVAIITDRDVVLAASGNRSKDYIDKALSLPLEQTMADRKTLHLNAGEGKTISMIASEEEASYVCQVVVPFKRRRSHRYRSAGRPRSRQRHGDAELKVAQTAANYIGRQMES